MLSVKLIDDYIIKSQDIKTFQIQLLRDGQPHAIPTDCNVTLLIANSKAIVKEEEMVIVDAEQGIVQFTLKATIGTGSFDCEFILSNGNDVNLTFPDNGYTVLKISECLSERPVQEITPSEYEALNERMDGFIMELDIFEDNVEDILADYETTFADMRTGMEATFNTMQTEFDKDVANLTAANNTFKNEMTNANNTFKNEVTANVGTYDGRLEAIEGSVKTVTGLDQPVNTIENANNLVEVVNVQGNTMQNLLKGEGCFDTDAENRALWTMTAGVNGAQVTLAQNGTDLQWFYAIVRKSNIQNMLKPNTTYTAFFEITVPSDTSGYILIQKGDSTNRYATQTNTITFPKGTSRHAVKLTTIADFSELVPDEMVGLYIGIGAKGFVTGDELDFKNAMILEGDWTGVDYVPFVDGIQSVDTVEVKSIGKNIADLSTSYGGFYTTYEILNENEVKVSGNWYVLFPLQCKPNTTYHVKGETEGEFTNATIYTLTESNQLKTYNNGMSGRGLTGFEFNFTSHPTDNMGLLLYANNTDTATSETIYRNVQIEEGTTATAYEPYQETVLQIPLTQPLMKLPKGACDIIENGKIIRKVKKLVLEGNEPVAFIHERETVFRIGLRYYFDDWVNDTLYGNSNVINDTYLKVSGDFHTLDKEHYYFSASDNYLYIFLDKSKVTNSATAIQEYLKTNPITFYYQLATPVEEEIPTFNEILETYPNGHILLNGTVLPTVNVEYCVGLTGKVLNLEEELVENRERIIELEENLYTAEDVYNYWNK